MLVLADRGFYGFRLVAQAAATGADLLWRVQDNLHGARRDARRRVVAGRGATPRRQRRTATPTVDGAGHRLHHRRRPRRGRARTGWSPRSSTPTRRQPPSWPPPTPNGGRSSPPSTSSRPINAGPARCCAQEVPTSCCKRSGDTCAATTPSAHLMFDAAEQAGRDPDQVSFVAALRVSRRSIAQQGAFPP